MRIIPAIDVIDGKCVRLSQGDFNLKKVYNEDPLAVARTFEDAGLRHAHVVDLDGARVGHVVNKRVVERIAASTNLQIDFGGGVKKTNDMEMLFDLGVRQVNVGSIAVKDPVLVREWIERFGRRIILSADVKDEQVYTQGWQNNSQLDLFQFLRGYVQAGVAYVACTDIATDGMLKGTNVSLYRQILEKFETLKLIASGGVSTLSDLEELKDIGVDGVIVGKAIYEGLITLDQLTSYDN